MNIQPRLRGSRGMSPPIGLHTSQVCPALFDGLDEVRELAEPKARREFVVLYPSGEMFVTAMRMCLDMATSQGVNLPGMAGKGTA